MRRAGGRLAAVILGAALGLGATLGLGVCAAARAEEPGAQALRAAETLRASVAALDAAQSAPDRVAALTQTIGAYEDGLAALRAGLRRAAVREAELRDALAARGEDLARLLAVMSTMERSEGPLLLLHPAGPVGTARAGMILSDVTPAIRSEAEALRAQLEEIAGLRLVQQTAAQTLAGGLAAVQGARTALGQAIAERTDLPTRYLEEPQELRRLVESADTMEGFATGLIDIESDIGAPGEEFEAAMGAMHLPVHGRLVHPAGEPDAAGIRRPGMILETDPFALVTAPWPATIRYRGPLLDYGNVMILEPQSGYLLVLAGLGTVYGETGDVLSTGDPVGQMAGRDMAATEFGAGFVASATAGAAPQAEDAAGAGETLYLELRLNGKPVDPGPWFIETKDNQG